MMGKVSYPDFDLNTSVYIADGQQGAVAINDQGYILVALLDTSGYLNVKYGGLDFNNQTINWTGNLTKVTVNAKSIVAFSVDVTLNSKGYFIIVFHEGNKNCYCVYGQLDNNGISFAGQVEYADGIYPKISLNNNDLFVEVHQSEHFSSLYYGIGTLTTNNGALSLQFTKKNVGYLELTGGKASMAPSIAINQNDKAVEVHMSGLNYDLYYLQATISDSKLDIQKDQQFLDNDNTDDAIQGRDLAVALSEHDYVIQAFANGKQQLMASVTRYSDRSAWMADYADSTLAQLSIPGSHDAGMSTVTYDTIGGAGGNSLTQIINIAGQLEAGIRYFDLRPFWKQEKTIYTGHFTMTMGALEGCSGESMEDVLDAVRTFISDTAHTDEVVILKFSHYAYSTPEIVSAIRTLYFFNNKSDTLTIRQNMINLLVDQVNQYLGDYLYQAPENAPRIAQTKLSDITKGKGKVIILFDLEGLKKVNFEGKGFYSYADLPVDKTDAETSSISDPAQAQALADMVVYDRYTHTNDLALMTSATEPKGQLYRIQQTDNHCGDLYVNSWTLTLTNWEVINPGAYTILELCQLANGVLAHDTMQSTQAPKDGSAIITTSHFPNIIYVDSADGFATDVCTWLNDMRKDGKLSS
jgi:hypothetical protein